MKNRTMRMAVLTSVLAVVLMTYFISGNSISQVRASSNSSLSLSPIQKRLLDGFASFEMDPPHGPNASRSKAISYFPDHADDQCALQLEGNTKVNQNCLNLADADLQGRSQAQNETAIAEDPFNPRHIVASYNDYRRGDGTCGVSYTLNGGANWNDATLPNGFVRGTAYGDVERQYWQASGDPSVAWDTRGNVYYDCMAFMRGNSGLTNNPDLSSGIFLFRSTQNNGASWNFTGRPVAQLNNPGPNEVPLLDKPYMTVDNHTSSPFRDRIYVTYTLFGANGTAYIFEAFSRDFGQTFSSPVLVSTSSPLCTNTYGLPTPSGPCNANQFSDPFTGPDGALYVVYDNYNNSLASATDNHNQILLVKSTNGGVSFSAPVLVANFNDLPDCDTYQGAGQNPGRACVPEKGTSTHSVFRAANYASGAVKPTDPSQVVVTFASYINAGSKPSNGCIPAGFAADGQALYIGVKTFGACNNKILESVSTNGGTSFNGTVTDPTKLPIVSSASGQEKTDQWWQWEVFTKGGKLAVSYYDRQYGNDEFNGFMDYSISGSTHNGDDDFNGFMDYSISDSTHTGFAVARVTSASMPPPTEFPNSFGNGVFFGDYSGITAVTHAYPLWMDTRDKELFYCTPQGVPAVCGGVEVSGLQANDQDIFTQRVAVP